MAMGRLRVGIYLFCTLVPAPTNGPIDNRASHDIYSLFYSVLVRSKNTLPVSFDRSKGRSCEGLFPTRAFKVRHHIMIIVNICSKSLYNFTCLAMVALCQ